MRASHCASFVEGTFEELNNLFVSVLSPDFSYTEAKLLLIDRHIEIINFG